VGLRDVWNRSLVYFGIAEEDEYLDEDDFSAAETDLERTYSDRPNVRRLHHGRQAAQPDFDDWSEPEAAPPAPKPARSSNRRTRGAQLEAVSAGATASLSSSQRVHLVMPRSFNDAQSIADKFKESIPVILNLQSADPELAKRLIDFSSGLTYALNGGMQRVADKVFLLTPRNVEVSAEERARLLERGFFNQA
jgi:cell division inhibitor SepF